MDTSLFSRSYQSPTGSPIRELFPYLSKPGLISFAGGYPSPELFDGDGLKEAAARVTGGSNDVYQYGPTEGLLALRERLAELGQKRGVEAQAQNLLVTTGSQQAFDLLVKTLLDPGDTVLVELPAYPATLQALRLAQVQVLGVPMDAHGLQTESLRSTLQALRTASRPKLLYTVPTFSNPSGTVLCEARRASLVELALEYGFFIVEDDPYGELSFTSDLHKPLYRHGMEMAGSRNPVIYLSSLSKTVAPALRTGWMAANDDILRRCAIAKQTADLCSSPLTQMIATEYLGLGRYDAAVERACRTYQERMQVMTDGLNALLSHQLSFVQPQGGMFLWADLHPDMPLPDLFDACVREGVLYVPGTAFFPTPIARKSIRMSFASPGLADIQEGVNRLRRAMDAVAPVIRSSRANASVAAGV